MDELAENMCIVAVHVSSAVPAGTGWRAVGLQALPPCHLADSQALAEAFNRPRLVTGKATAGSHVSC